MPIIKIKKPIIALLIFNIAINGLNFFNIPESKANNEEIQAQASVEYQNEIESIQINFEN
jgi:hypothetical protein